MSLRLIAPFAGIVGSIASVAGVSTSSSRSNDSANKGPFHKGKTEIPSEIVAELECPELKFDTGQGVESGTGIKFRLVWSLKGISVEDLNNGRQVDSGVQLIVSDKENQKLLWPVETGKGGSKVTVTLQDHGKKLRVELSETDEPLTGRTGNRRTSGTDRTFECVGNASGGGRWSSRLYYEEGNLKNTKWTRTTSENNLKAKVSLTEKNCQTNEEKQIVTCDLKVVTGNNLNGLYCI